MDKRSGKTEGPPDRGASAVGAFRAVVCLQIVAMHAYFVDLAGWVGPAGSWAVTHLRFGFESFFVLAGFFLAHAFRPGEWSYLSVPQFFRRRLLRLILPYWVALLLGFAGYELRERLTGVATPLGGFGDFWPLALGVQDLAAAHSPSVAYWFMAPLLQFYILWGVLFWAVRRTHIGHEAKDYHARTLRVMAVLVTAAMLGSLACLASGDRFRWRLADNAVYLSLGCLAYWSGHDRGVRVWWLAGAAGLVAVGLYYELSRPLAAVASAFLLPYLVLHPYLPANAVTRSLEFVGERSFSVYLTHTYVAPRVLKLEWPVSGNESAAAAAILWCLSLAASLGFGCVFYALVEKPTARLARLVRFRGSHVPVPPL